MNSRNYSIVTSLVKNGVWTTSKYLIGYFLHKVNLKNYIDYKGTSINLRPDSSDFSVFREIFLSNEYDLPYPEKVKIVVDAGANIGASTVWFAKKFPGAKIFAIEPDSDNFSVLCKNVKNLDNVIPINKGLWSSPQKLLVSNRAEIGEWGRYVTPDINSSESTIDGITINDLINNYELDQIDIFKIDVEGAEKEIFKVSNWIGKVKVLIIETHDWLEEGCSKRVFGALKDFNFNTSFSGEKFVFRIEN